MRTPSHLSDLHGETFDVIVMGGGAVGASATQHLAAKGFKVLLVEQGDFASGTSSRSSRLLYSGLSYLAPPYPLWQLPFRPRDALMRLRMVRTCMHSRNEIATTSPDRVKACAFVFPAQKDGRYPSWLIGAGYRLLSLFQSRRAPLAVRRLSVAQAARENGMIRLLDQDSIASVTAFREYQYDWAERICMDAVMDAERLGARVANYVGVRGFRQEAGEWSVELGAGPRPGRVSDLSGDNRRATVKARFLVNAAGPWIDRLLRTGPNPTERRVRGVKGVNLVVRLPEDCRRLGLEAVNSRDQAFYVMPWGDYHFIGPTETDYEGDPAAVRVLPEEVDFLLGEANRIFPTLKLSHEDVVYRWAGVRPGTIAKGSDFTFALTLHDLAQNGLTNAIAVTGAPIMLHRIAGRRIARFVSRRLQPTGTPGRVDYGAKHLPTDDGPHIGGVPITTLRAAVEREHVHTLLDLMFRRVNLGWQADMGLSTARLVAEAVADLLDWDCAAVTAEVAAYEAFVRDNFAPRTSGGSRSTAPSPRPT